MSSKRAWWLAGLAEVVSLVFWCAKGGSEDSEPSLLGRECRVSDPNVCSKRFQVGRRDARKVPDSGFATVELDVRVGVEVVCQEIVDRFHPMWLDHCVDIVQVYKHRGFPLREAENGRLGWPRVAIHVSMYPCIHVSMYPCIHVSVY